MNKKRNKILESFRIEDLENKETLKSIIDALEACDMAERVEFRERVELATVTG